MADLLSRNRRPLYRGGGETDSMQLAAADRSLGANPDDARHWPVPRRQAWFAFVMSFLLMVFDFMDRQIVVSTFPALKAEWGLSDKQLGALTSVVAVTVALFASPSPCWPTVGAG